jgi:hypothetical protein
MPTVKKQKCSKFKKKTSLVVRGLKKADRKNLAIINCGRTDM